MQNIGLNTVPPSKSGHSLWFQNTKLPFSWGFQDKLPKTTGRHTLRKQPVISTNFPLFTGPRTEQAVGLVHLDARWYNPHSTRFVQPDLWNFASTGLPPEVQHEVMQFVGLNTGQLLRDPGQQMKYGYVTSNPFTLVDHTGLISSDYFKLSNIAGFIKDEGANVAIQTGQAIGGAGQIGLGAALCTGSSGAACGAGAVLIAKGADNFHSGITGEKSKAQEGLEQLTGNKTVATTVNAAIDLGTSVYGLVKSVPKIVGGFKDFTLFGKDPTAFEPALKQATQVGLGAEIFASSTTLIDTASKVCRP